MGDINFKSARGTGSFNEPTREAIFERDGRRCRFCHSSSGLRVDHIMPRSKGGTDDPKNLQTLCDDCNRYKLNRSQGFMFHFQVGHFTAGAIRFQPEFVQITGDVNTALVLSTIVDFLPESWDSDAAISLTDDQWDAVTGLTRRQRDRAINRLVKAGLIHVRRQGMPARLFIAINLEYLTDCLYDIIHRWIENRRVQLHPQVEQATSQLHPQVEQSDTHTALQLHPDAQQAHGSDPLTTPVHTRESVSSGSSSSSNGNKRATELSETVAAHDVHVGAHAQPELIERDIEPTWREVLEILASVPTRPGESTVKRNDYALIDWAKAKSFDPADAVESATYLTASWRRLKYHDVRAAFQANLLSKRNRAKRDGSNGDGAPADVDPLDAYRRSYGRYMKAAP